MERVTEGRVMGGRLPGVTRGTPDGGSGPELSEGPEVVTEVFGDFGVKKLNIFNKTKSPDERTGPW